MWIADTTGPASRNLVSSWRSASYATWGPCRLGRLPSASSDNVHLQTGWMTQAARHAKLIKHLRSWDVLYDPSIYSERPFQLWTEISETIRPPERVRNSAPESFAGYDNGGRLGFCPCPLKIKWWFTVPANWTSKNKKKRIEEECWRLHTMRSVQNLIVARVYLERFRATLRHLWAILES